MPRKENTSKSIIQSSILIKKFLKLIRSSYFFVGSLLIVGIFATFLREIVLAYFYGTSEEVEIFRLSILVPHMLTQTCAPAFIAACLTLLSKKNELGDGKPERTVYYCNLLFSFGLTLVGLGTCSIQSRVLAPGFDERTQEVLSLGMVYSWIYFLLASLSYTSRSRLLNRDIYWPGPASSSLISFSFMAVVIIYQFFPFLEPDSNSLSVAIVFSGLSVFAVHFAAAKSYGLEKISVKKIAFSDKLIRLFFYTVAGAILFKFLNFVPRLFDRVIATTMEQGVLACLEYGFGILNVFGILIGTSLTTVIAPRFLKRYSTLGLEKTLRKFLNVLLVGFAASVVLAIVLAMYADYAISIIFQRGSFDRDAVEQTASIFRWQIMALPLINMTLVLSQIYILIEKIRLLLFAVALKICLKVTSLALFNNLLQESLFGVTLFISELGFLLILIVFLQTEKTNVFKDSHLVK